jgi:hypothetical protein
MRSIFMFTVSFTVRSIGLMAWTNAYCAAHSPQLATEAKTRMNGVSSVTRLLSKASHSCVVS